MRRPGDPNGNCDCKPPAGPEVVMRPEERGQAAHWGAVRSRIHGHLQSRFDRDGRGTVMGGWLLLAILRPSCRDTVCNDLSLLRPARVKAFGTTESSASAKLHVGLPYQSLERRTQTFNLRSASAGTPRCSAGAAGTPSSVGADTSSYRGVVMLRAAAGRAACALSERRDGDRALCARRPSHAGASRRASALYFSAEAGPKNS